jgi:transcription antitermination protein NusB
MFTRRDNRIGAVQFLYMHAINHPNSLEHALHDFWKSQDKACTDFSFAEQLIKGVLSHCNEIDIIIKRSVKNWDFERIAKVDLAILRLALYEIQFCNDIPSIVSINEAIEISKILSGLDSKRFINGILDQYINQTASKANQSPEPHPLVKPQSP